MSGSNGFPFSRLCREGSPYPQGSFHFHHIFNFTKATCCTEGLGSLLQHGPRLSQMTTGRISSSSGFLLISPPTPPPTHRAQPSTGAWVEHLDLLTAKVTSTSTQKRKPARLELGRLGKEYDKWSDSGSNGESQKPKMGWILHKRKCIQYTHTPQAWCGFSSITSSIRP